MGISNIYIEWLTSVNLRDVHIYQRIYTRTAETSVIWALGRTSSIRLYGVDWNHG